MAFIPNEGMTIWNILRYGGDVMASLWKVHRAKRKVHASMLHGDALATIHFDFLNPRFIRHFSCCHTLPTEICFEEHIFKLKRNDFLLHEIIARIKFYVVIRLFSCMDSSERMVVIVLVHTWAWRMGHLACVE